MELIWLGIGLITAFVISLALMFVGVHFFRSSGNHKNDLKIASILAGAVSVGGIMLQLNLLLGIVAYFACLFLIKKILAYSYVGASLFLLTFGLIMSVVAEIFA